MEEKGSKWGGECGYEGVLRPSVELTAETEVKMTRYNAIRSIGIVSASASSGAVFMSL